MRVHELKEFLEICEDDAEILITDTAGIINYSFHISNQAIGHDENVYLFAGAQVGITPTSVFELV